MIESLNHRIIKFLGYFVFALRSKLAIFSPLRPTTYPPKPISNKSQKREVSARIGRLVNVPARIITANVSITSGRHERCNQLPRASSPSTVACAAAPCRSSSTITRIKSASNCFFLPSRERQAVDHLANRTDHVLYCFQNRNRVTIQFFISAWK